MNRYEEILVRLVAAKVYDGWNADYAAEEPTLRKAANLLEAHFQARDEALQQEQALALRQCRE